MDPWASQLRGYRGGTQKKPLRASAASKKSFPGRQANRNSGQKIDATNKDLNNCAKLLSHLLDTGSAGPLTTKTRHPAVTVNRLRKDKANGLNSSKCRKVKRVPKVEHKKSGTRPGESPQKQDGSHIADQSDIIRDEELVPATETHAAIHRTVRIPTVLNQNDYDEDEDEEADEDTEAQPRSVSTSHPLESLKAVHISGPGVPPTMTNNPETVSHTTDSLQNPLQPFRPTVLPSYPTISGLPVPSAMSSSRPLPENPVLSTPFNKRLSSSTPNTSMTPSKIAGTAQIRVTGTAQNYALNSTDEIRPFHPVTTNPGPKLREGVVDFQPRPQGIGPSPHTSAVSKEVLGNFSMYSDTRGPAVAEVPTRDTDPVRVPQSVGTVGPAQQTVQQLHAAAHTAAHTAPLPRFGQVDRPQFTNNVPHHPQPASSTTQGQLGPGQSPLTQTPDPKVSIGYTPVQPLTLPLYQRKPSPQPPAISNTPSGDQDRDVLSKIPDCNVDSGTEETESPNTEPFSPEPGDVSPTSPVEKSPSKKARDKVTWAEKATDSKKTRKKKKVPTATLR